LPDGQSLSPLQPQAWFTQTGPLVLGGFVQLVQVPLEPQVPLAVPATQTGFVGMLRSQQPLEQAGRQAPTPVEALKSQQSPPLQACVGSQAAAQVPLAAATSGRWSAQPGPVKRAKPSGLTPLKKISGLKLTGLQVWVGVSQHCPLGQVVQTVLMQQLPFGHPVAGTADPFGAQHRLSRAMSLSGLH
jgi:hypothetical protein